MTSTRRRSPAASGTGLAAGSGSVDSGRRISKTAPAPSPAEIRARAQRAIEAGDADTLATLMRAHPRALDVTPDDDARAIVAREHVFDTWEQYLAHVEAVKDGASPVARFERAVEAAIDGDTPALAGMLREDPSVVHARSTRTHHATLLLYVGANGVDGWRQAYR